MTTDYDVWPEDTKLFDEWSSLNGVICDWRCRFDDLRANFYKCQTRDEAGELLEAVGVLTRYPKLPERLA